MPTQPLDDAALAEIRARANAASHGAELWRYDHGGGRMAIIEDDGARKLVADLYHVEDREFYARALADVYDLLDALAAARAECERLRGEREDARWNAYRAGWLDSDGGPMQSYEARVAEAEYRASTYVDARTPTPGAGQGGGTCD